MRKKLSFLKLLMVCMALVLMVSCTNSNSKTVLSPNHQVQATINIAGGIKYSLAFNNDTIIDHSSIKWVLKGGKNLENFEVLKTEEETVNNEWDAVWGKRKKVTNNYNQLKIYLRELNTGILLNLYIRAYNDGLGIRYGFPEQQNLKSFELAQEKTQFAFTANHQVWRADYKCYKSSQEQEFLNKRLSTITPKQFIGMPLLVKVNENAYAAITEADLTNWSGAFLRSGSLKNTMVTELTPHTQDTSIAVKRNTPALSPWRVVMVAKQPGGLIESDLIANLNDPVALDDYSWIKPGTTAWDWWWSNRYAPSVNFEVGPNQETMKYFIDFAAKMQWDYQLVDWQWYGHPFLEEGSHNAPNPNVDITTCTDVIDIPSLVEYADKKNVKLIIWLHWWHLNRQMDEAMALYEKWGVSGIKIDFMDRQDQEMVNFYHKVVKKAAEHKLLVDFHGAYKPTGVSRTYPNMITREGVMGNEYTKWSNRITPEHNVTLPFTRGLLGEMDYTPVAFRNVTPDEFVPEFEAEGGSPRVQTTRCHQLAMPVVYESALAIFCDSPDNYDLGTGLEFLKAIPTTWDDTKVLNASVGDYITIARKSGTTWYVGGMTDATERTMNIDLDFLSEGEYNVTLFQDADDANKVPANAVKKEMKVTSKNNISVNLAKGGGFAAVFNKIDD